MGRSFANLHIKSNSLEKSIEGLRELIERDPELLGLSANQDQMDSDVTQSRSVHESELVLYISSNEKWISVLHDYFVWGTVKRIGKSLSLLIGEPVITVGFMHDELFELSIFKDGEIQAERIFCEDWTRSEYGLQEELLHDDNMREALDIRQEDMDELATITSPAQAVDKLSELVSLPLWSDWEWIPHEEELNIQFAKYEL
ncbi:hypothetical protein [Paenibacillus paeoniae]|uniref:Uncharacterized protein n=1 Tax=Paenibacillus paeoniae TaxID=2292705 RepID=A0A371P6X2_9BACL|nr:hypothetical protein [Paenibacillus paeoniae]REK71693.1 hypothetical protein DX130_21960 [Paenibacillus paeoniae]